MPALEPTNALIDVAAVPEVPIAEDDDTRGSEHDVRSPGKSRDVNAVPKAKPPQSPPQKALAPRVPLPAGRTRGVRRDWRCRLKPSEAGDRWRARPRLRGSRRTSSARRSYHRPSWSPISARSSPMLRAASRPWTRDDLSPSTRGRNRPSNRGSARTRSQPRSRRRSMRSRRSRAHAAPLAHVTPRLSRGSSIPCTLAVRSMPGNSCRAGDDVR